MADPVNHSEGKETMLKQCRRYWLLIPAIMLSLLLLNISVLSTSPVLAEDGLKTYADSFVNKLNQEVDAIESFVSAYERVDFESQNSLSAFQRTLPSHKLVFNGFLTFYRTPVPADAPADLKEAVKFAISGTEKILNGIAAIDRAIGSLSNAQLQSGQNSLNEGVRSVDYAVDKYNAFVDAYNAQAKDGASVSGDDLGLGSTLNAIVSSGKPLLYVYVYLVIAGFILTFSFRRKLKKLVSGKIEGEKFKGTPLYGLHLGVLFPYLYALLAFSMLLVYLYALGAILMVANAGRIPIVLVIVLAAVVLGSFWAILKGLFGSKKRNILGIRLDRQEQPKIWELCDTVANEVGTRSVDEILLSPQPGIGVHLSSGLLGLLIGRTKRTLTIGMASISALTVPQMAAILAHEFGHFSSKDTAWNSLTFTMSATLQNTLSTIPSPWNAEGLLMKAASALNPALWVLLAYRYLFSIVTNGFSRMREVFADKTAIALYGYRNFTTGLVQVVRNDHIFSSHYLPEMIRLLTQEGKMFTNVFDAMSQSSKPAEHNEFADIDKSIMESEKQSMFDSHPTLKDRLSYAKHFEVEAKHAVREDDLKVLFVNWDEVSKKMSDLYTYYLASLTGYKFEEPQAKEEPEVN